MCAKNPNESPRGSMWKKININPPEDCSMGLKWTEGQSSQITNRNSKYDLRHDRPVQLYFFMLVSNVIHIG